MIEIVPSPPLFTNQPCKRSRVDRVVFSIEFLFDILRDRPCHCIISYRFSVLKDMVRDLEQMKENEEKQVKTTTEKNGHMCCNEHSDFLENHPNKMCHRSDGGCTCYYCTIFGHTVIYYISIVNCQDDY